MLVAFVTIGPGTWSNGMLITASGGSNVIRPNMISGKIGNGVELKGDATGVRVTDPSRRRPWPGQVVQHERGRGRRFQEVWKRPPKNEK